MKFKDFTLHAVNGYVQSNFLIEYRDKILLIDRARRAGAYGPPPSMAVVKTSAGDPAGMELFIRGRSRGSGTLGLLLIRPVSIYQKD